MDLSYLAGDRVGTVARAPLMLVLYPGHARILHLAVGCARHLPAEGEVGVAHRRSDDRARITAPAAAGHRNRRAGHFQRCHVHAGIDIQ